MASDKIEGEISGAIDELVTFIACLMSEVRGVAWCGVNNEVTTN